MKNQYVADINDFRKYGLIRSLLSSAALNCGVFWMLTDDDPGNDGNIISYLNKPSESAQLDPDLYKKLSDLVHTFKDRTVARIQQEAVLPRTFFFEDVVSDKISDRNKFFQTGMARLKGCHLVFFDPDNGLEVKSKKKGNKNSSKFLYLDEVKQAFDAGHSLLIYQHFPRIEHNAYIAGRVEQLKQSTRSKTVFSFSTGYVCFFLVAQDSHMTYLDAGIQIIRTRWAKQFTVKSHKL